MRKVFWLMMLAGIFMISCSNKNEFRIEGTLDGGAGKQIRLDLVMTNHLSTLDSTVLDDKGHFILKGELEQPTFGILRTPADQMFMVILHPGDRITVTGSYDNLEKEHTVQGSEDTKLFEAFRVYLQKNIDQLEALNMTYRDSLQSPNIAEITKDLRERSMAVINDQKAYTRQFLTDHAGSLASLLALYQQIAPGMYIMDPMEDLLYYERVDSALNAKYPASDPVITFHAQLAELRSRKRQQEIEERLLGIGKVPPDIALPDPQGDTLRLSSLRGKVVLLDFWASWCSPCRHENPNLVKNYEKYHKKGFEIFQVSLDRTKEAWMNGIEADHLGQWYHVSDLGYWQSAVVKLYHIQAIPANFLLDREGRIIARNLRGDALKAKLAEIFGS
jgi:peroxiredoxin